MEKGEGRGRVNWKREEEGNEEGNEEEGIRSGKKERLRFSQD